jgi:uncharacterized repeat protein (TIGR03803 family)
MKLGNFSGHAFEITSRRFIPLFLSLCFIATAAQAQSFTVLHAFSGGRDGGYPFTGLTLQGQTFFGTTFGGAADYGTVFSLKQVGSNWQFSTLHTFQNGPDGAGPSSPLIMGPDGALYGATSAGGGGPCLTSNGYHGCGTVYKVLPPPHASSNANANWNTTILYNFSGTDGSYPQGDLAFDNNGTLYGTTVNGGSADSGVIYTLTASTGHWTQNILYDVMNNGDGQFPWGGVIFDNAGDLYGVMTGGGPHDFGVVYELSPSGSGWTERAIHGFTDEGNDGMGPQSGLIRDPAGNLYGATVYLPNSGGSAFELTPSGGSWNYNFLSSFPGGLRLGPYASMVMDSAGNLYGTTFADGQYGYGTIFKLTRSNGSWTYQTLHTFTGGDDGASPMAPLIFDASGNLYGTTSGGGHYSAGVVFKITP